MFWTHGWTHVWTCKVIVSHSLRHNFILNEMHLPKDFILCQLFIFSYNLILLTFFPSAGSCPQKSWGYFIQEKRFFWYSCTNSQYLILFIYFDFEKMHKLTSFNQNAFFLLRIVRQFENINRRESNFRRDLRFDYFWQFFPLSHGWTIISIRHSQRNENRAQCCVGYLNPFSNIQVEWTKWTERRGKTGTQKRIEVWRKKDGNGGWCGGGGKLEGIQLARGVSGVWGEVREY